MFRQSARRLAGLTAILLGWRPEDFWRTTPEELATILAAHIHRDGTPADRAVLGRLKEKFPDG